MTFATSSVTGRHGFPLVAKFTPGDAGEELGRSQRFPQEIDGLPKGFGAYVQSGDRQGCTPIPTWAPYGESLDKAYTIGFCLGYNPQESLENMLQLKMAAMEEEDTDMDPEISSGFVRP